MAGAIMGMHAAEWLDANARFKRAVYASDLRRILGTVLLVR
jgi:hypothetical protein